MDSLNCLSYKRLVILHKLRCANCVTKILYFFHTTKLSVPVFSNFCLHTDFLFCPELSNYRIFVFTRSIADSHGFSFLLFLSRIFELSNFIFLVPRLVFGPTDRREVIIETCPWTHWPTGGNYRILSSHGLSRTVTDFSFFCHELENFRILSFLSRDLSFVPNYRIFVFRDLPWFSVWL